MKVSQIRLGTRVSVSPALRSRDRRFGVIIDVTRGEGRGTSTGTHLYPEVSLDEGGTYSHRAALINFISPPLIYPYEDVWLHCWMYWAAPSRYGLRAAEFHDPGRAYIRTRTTPELASALRKNPDNPYLIQYVRWNGPPPEYIEQWYGSRYDTWDDRSVLQGANP